MIQDSLADGLFENSVTRAENSPRQIALQVQDVSKSFRLPTEQATGLKQTFINWTRGIKGYTTQEVLKDISFTVEKGDFFGIVGRNGSGKSTLLKIISQIYQPENGTVDINGKLVSFIELGVGFNPELTGRENVYLNGALLGFTSSEIDEMYQDIVDFAEIEPFMDQKLKNYSSGMQVRLAFSVAIEARGDILVLDEVLAVGDEAFQKKCQDFFFEAKREEKTIILVTHSMGDIRKYCNKAMLIKDGEIAEIGNPDDVATAYSDIFLEEESEKTATENANVDLVTRKDVELLQVGVFTKAGEQQYLGINEDFEVRIKFNCKREISQGVIAINLVDQAGRISLATSTKILGKEKSYSVGEHQVSFFVENVLGSGDYQINVAVASNYDLLLKQQDLYKFHIQKDKYYDQSLTHPKIRIEED